MKINVALPQDTQVKPGFQTYSIDKMEPILLVTEKELTERNGKTLCVIEVANEDGKLTKFWLSAHISNQGKPTLTLTTKTAEDREFKKILAGTARKQKSSM